MAVSVSRVALVVLALAFVAFGRVEAAIGPRATLTIANKVIAPDGFPRSAVLAGGTFPGPLIRGKTGDRLKINVVNALADKTMAVDTTIHWHGLFQKGTNWADGVAMVTQCPIIPGHSFLYDFRVPDQAGTFWYHSHLGTQYCDGLRGPLVIYSKNDPHKHLYDVDDESTVLTIGDWYHLPAPELAGVPHPDATLFNGLGRSLNGPKSPLYVMNVVRGKRYRIRLINIGCDSNYQFSIDGHSFTVIEADGEDTRPLEVDRVQIFSGQRYSLILKANRPIGNYWIRGNPNSGDPGYENQMNSAILRYRGAPWIDPTTHERNATKPLIESELRPLRHERAPGRPYPGGADVNINLNFGFDPKTALFTTNNQTFVPPSVPVLLQILSGAHDVHELAPSGTIYDIKHGQVVELTMPALAFAGPHPMHLHGHAFSVVRSAGSKTYNYDNPLRRDVVNIGTDPTDNVTIRFVADNSGPWFLHCHIDWHLDLGFAVVFAEATAQTKKDNPVPKAWKDLCPLYNSSSPAKLLMGTNALHRLPA
ncbi:laccase [Pleurotus ostreatus PC15]|uniref:laccase n=1 Tax=Pleurotus ostreatus (strain PC15) TaxID=1137138 RepID=A0A067NH12_PLEO1|nr:laccase [Pleurotus ostreatus PC15]